MTDYAENIQEFEWIFTTALLPPEGVKVLYFLNGDIGVVYRFGDKWYPIPFTDSKFANFYINHAPDLWAYIPFPEGYNGEMLMGVKGEEELMTINELKTLHPNAYEEFTKAWEENVQKSQELNKNSEVYKKSTKVKKFIG